MVKLIKSSINQQDNSKVSLETDKTWKWYINSLKMDKRLIDPLKLHPGIITCLQTAIRTMARTELTGDKQCGLGY